MEMKGVTHLSELCFRRKLNKIDEFGYNWLFKMCLYCIRSAEPLRLERGL